MDFMNEILTTLSAIDAFFFAHPSALVMAALSAFTTGMSLGYIHVCFLNVGH
jgi:hypothetical protein